MITFSELEIKFKIVHRQLLIELTERSGSKQHSRRNLIKSSAQLFKTRTLSSTEHKLSTNLQQWRIKVSLIFAFATISWRIWMKLVWLRITLPVYSLIKLRDLTAESWTKPTGSLRSATNSKRERLTRSWAVSSGSPMRRRANALMLPCLYFQF
jgi:hypothetical protein